MALANLRGNRQQAALDAANKLHRLFPERSSTKGTVAGTRSILLRYDALSIDLYREAIEEVGGREYGRGGGRGGKKGAVVLRGGA